MINTLPKTWGFGKRKKKVPVAESGAAAAAFAFRGGFNSKIFSANGRTTHQSNALQQSLPVLAIGVPLYGALVLDLGCG